MGVKAGPGLEVHQNVDVDESEDAVKTSEGILYGYHLFNDSAGSIFVKLYDATVATVVVGTTTPKMTLGLPAGSGAVVHIPEGIRFRTAITIAATTGPTVADTGAPGANECQATLWFD